MSKSRGNVVNPDDYVNQMGADTVRCYLMFIAPWERGGDWNDSGISGLNRWLKRVWNLVTEGYRQKTISPDEKQKAEQDTNHFIHKTIKNVTNDMEKMRFNVMIASLMEYTNYLDDVRSKGAISEDLWNMGIERLMLLIAPSAPHMAEELWEISGREYSIHNQKWPEWDEETAEADEITFVIQVNGKLRDRFQVPVTISEEEARKLAVESPRVRPHIDGKKIVKEIFVPGKLFNMVVK
jgi:leucyl-tRNA synthetase